MKTPDTMTTDGKIMFNLGRRKSAHGKYSSSEHNLVYLPFDRNGKAEVKMKLSQNSVMKSSPSSETVCNIVPAKSKSQASTALNNVPASSKLQHCNKTRAQEIDNGIKRRLVRHSERRNARTLNGPPEQNKPALQENRHSDGKHQRQEDSSILSPKKENTTAYPKPTADDNNDEQKSPTSPRSIWKEEKDYTCMSVSLALAAIRSRNIIENPISSSEEEMGKIVSSDDISFVSDITMSVDLTESKNISRTNPPPPPRRQDLQRQTFKVPPPPPPPRRCRRSSTSSFSHSSRPPLPSPYSPPRRNIIVKAPATPPPPPPKRVLNKTLPASLSLTDSCPDILCREQECDVIRSSSSYEKPHAKSLRKPPPPPPAPSQSKIVGKLPLSSSFFMSRPDNITCNHEDEYNTIGSLTSSEKDLSDFSATSSSGKSSIKQRQAFTFTGGERESNAALIRDTLKTKSSALEESRRSRNPLPPPRFLPNPIRNDGKINEIPSPPKNLYQNPPPDSAKHIYKPPSIESKTDARTSKSSLHDRNSVHDKPIKTNSISSSESDEFIPTRGYKDTAKGGTHIIAKNRTLPASNLPKFDNHGRCLRHPSVILAKKKSFGRGWIIIRDGCQRCIQERSNASCSWKEDSFRSADSNTKIPKPSSKIMPSRRAHNLTDAAASAMFKREPKIDRGENHTSFQIQSNESHRLADTSERVAKMPYTTPWGKSGWYSGEVTTHGIPNGTGRMRFKNGDQYEGQWINGYSEQFLENSRRTKRGFSKNRRSWNEKNKPDSRPTQKPAASCRQDAKSVLHPSQIMQPGYYQLAPIPPPHQPQYGNFLHQQHAYNQFQ